MSKKLIRRLACLALVAAAPAVRAAEDTAPWKDAATGYATLFSYVLSPLDDAEARRAAERESVWTDAGSGFKALFEHQPYRGPAKAAKVAGSPDGV